MEKSSFPNVRIKTMKTEMEKDPAGKGGRINPPNGRHTRTFTSTPQTVVIKTKFMGRCEGLKGQIFNCVD